MLNKEPLLKMLYAEIERFEAKIIELKLLVEWVEHYKDALKAMKELREYNELLIELYRMRNSDKDE